MICVITLLRKNRVNIGYARGRGERMCESMCTCVYVLKDTSRSHLPIARSLFIAQLDTRNKVGDILVEMNVQSFHMTAITHK